MSNLETIGKRFSPEECVEILTECSGIEDCIRVLRAKAQEDMDWHLEESLRANLKIVVDNTE